MKRISALLFTVLILFCSAYPVFAFTTDYYTTTYDGETLWKSQYAQDSWHTQSADEDDDSHFAFETVWQIWDDKKETLYEQVRMNISCYNYKKISDFGDGYYLYIRYSGVYSKYASLKDVMNEWIEYSKDSSDAREFREMTVGGRDALYVYYVNEHHFDNDAGEDSFYWNHYGDLYILLDEDEAVFEDRNYHPAIVSFTVDFTAYNDYDAQSGIMWSALDALNYDIIVNTERDEITEGYDPEAEAEKAAEAAAEAAEEAGETGDSPDEENDSPIEWKTIAVIGGGGAVVLITIGVIKGAAGAAAGKAAAGAGKAAAAAAAPKEETYILTDPSTGAQSLYIKDTANGEWVSSDGNSVLDMDKVKNWQKTRVSDRSWQNTQNENLKNRNDWYSEANRNMAKENERATKQVEKEIYIDRVASKRGIASNDTATIREELGKKQAKAEIRSQEAHNTADRWDNAVKAAEFTQYAADTGVDVLSNFTGPAGKAIKNSYTVLKNGASRLSDAVVNDKDITAALAQAGIDSVIDIGQGQLESIGWHYTGNIGGDSLKQITNNLYEGKDWNEGLGEAAVKGTVKGTISKIGQFFSSDGAMTKQTLKDDLNLIRYTEHSVYPPKSVEPLREMRILSYINNSRADKVLNAISTGAVDTGKTVVDGVASAYDDISAAQAARKGL